MKYGRGHLSVLRDVCINYTTFLVKKPPATMHMFLPHQLQGLQSGRSPSTLTSRKILGNPFRRASRSTLSAETVRALLRISARSRGSSADPRRYIEDRAIQGAQFRRGYLLDMLGCSIRLGSTPTREPAVGFPMPWH